MVNQKAFTKPMYMNAFAKYRFNFNGITFRMVFVLTLHIHSNKTNTFVDKRMKRTVLKCPCSVFMLCSRQEDEKNCIKMSLLCIHVVFYTRG